MNAQRIVFASSWSRVLPISVVIGFVFTLTSARLIAQSSSNAEPLSDTPGDLQEDDYQPVSICGLTLSVPWRWKLGTDVAPDEGHWVTEQADIRLLRDRSLRDLQGEMLIEQKIETQFAGAPALWVEGVAFTSAGPRRVRILVHAPLRDVDQWALVVQATPDEWRQYEQEFRQLFQSAVGASLPDSETSAIPQTTTTDNPDSADSNEHEASEVDSGVTEPESPATTGPRKPPASSSNDPVASPRDEEDASIDERLRYEHPRGGYSIDLPSGWSVARGWSVDRADADFDTLWDQRREVAVVMARVREAVNDVDQSLEQWRDARMASLQDAEGLNSETMQLSGAKAVAISYREPSTGLASWRFSLGHENYRYAISVYTLNASNQKLPAAVRELLNSLHWSRSWTRRDADVVAYEMEGITMHLPAAWRAVDDPSRYDRYGDADAIWFREHQGQLTRLKLFRLTPNTSPLPDTNRTLLIGSMLTGGNQVWWLLGSRRVPASMIATAVFNREDDQSMRWALSFETPIDQWAVMESEFRSILAATDLSASKRVDPFPMPRWGVAYTTVEAIPNLRGDSQYQLIDRPEGVELRDHQTRERVFIPVARFENGFDPAVSNPLINDAHATSQLGAPLGDTISVFDDELRVQLFRKGVVVMESAHRAFWWSSHAARPPQPE